MTIFILMKRDPAYTGIGGYLNSSNRTDVTDCQLLIAAETLGLDYASLFLWVNSRYARHFMDDPPHLDPHGNLLSGLETVQKFVDQIQGALPDLLEEFRREQK